ncbi:hypothetical protein AXF42_Ash016626 [Apostasia shenzhenica]|uniref:Uncharacterized protein n=1 Tax=Apostasia shenzhenica TaxID=1088818 RepID=A0A2I0A1L7_9ASPA|nr:hypothetical protein AXF42_Ash016626 [Apostasia shenzhenica]
MHMDVNVAMLMVLEEKKCETFIAGHASDEKVSISFLPKNNPSPIRQNSQVSNDSAKGVSSTHCRVRSHIWDNRFPLEGYDSVTFSPAF